jgi:D-sedoheptulose 7-phosphate isomerase
VRPSNIEADVAVSEVTFARSGVAERMSHAEAFFAAATQLCRNMSFASIEALASELDRLRERRGRLFLIGVGGSAAIAVTRSTTSVSSAASRPTAQPTMCPNLPHEPTTRAGDTVFAAWLETGRLDERDAILVFSVGGGDAERNISANTVKAIDLAKARRAKVFGIVGHDSGHTAKHGDLVVFIPQVDPNWVTPLSEAFQAVVWHCLVSHPSLQRRPTKCHLSRNVRVNR